MTTFDVYAASARTPGFDEVVRLAQRRLGEFAADYKLGNVPAIRFSLHEPEEKVSPLEPAAEMIWSQASYVWFEFGDANGGTDAYYRALADEDRGDWEEEIRTRAAAKRLGPLIQACLRNRGTWWFRRSAGQPAIVNLGYGYLAASLAELTGGFIYSDDGARDFEALPCSAADFYTFYFRPERATNRRLADWSAENLECLRKGGMEA